MNFNYKLKKKGIKCKYVLQYTFLTVSQNNEIIKIYFRGKVILR